MKCKVRISSSGSNWKDNVLSLGEFNENGGRITVSYKINGDKCELVYSDKKAVQKRSGEQNVEMTFSAGETTFCSLGSGSFCGGFDIFTNSVVFDKKDNGFEILLDYMSGDENIKLAFTVVV